ncbi:MAG: nitrogenase iron-molybdenum cofactor biosynthesis protein NifE [Planctomycetota bacterium]|nr:nitrogenase iron-molybdenum cofactor biosynthesis protein NifE [Planctomycetota bacterium]
MSAEVPALTVPLEARRTAVTTAAAGPPVCDRPSVAGSVTQRACTFCGSRVVLYPIADALHLVHGAVGCAAYTWDIRGALSSGPQLHRNSFSTDLREQDVIFGGERRLAAALDELIPRYQPRAAFVYATCLTGVIGDDIEAVCRVAAAKHGIPVIPVQSEGFRGTKKLGYSAACQALASLIGTADASSVPPRAINILGDFNIAGEAWTIRGYYERLGIPVHAIITGDGRVDEIRRAHGATLNVVQCAGSMTPLARLMRERYGTPFIQVSFFGLEDCADAIYRVAEHFADRDLLARARDLVRAETAAGLPELERLRRDLAGRSAALYVGGAFKAISLVKALRLLGMRVVIAGTQTGSRDEYAALAALCDRDTIIVDDSNPLELAQWLSERRVDLFIGGVKERPIAYKLGIGFCDHNHERKIGLAGFRGMLAFAREVHATVTSPVWSLVPRQAAESER